MAESIDIEVIPTLSGGEGISVATGSIGATVTQVKSTGGQVMGWYVFNSNTVTVYMQVFNAIPTNVTLGTTAPYASYGIPAGSGANVLSERGIQFSTGISIAFTTTRSGSTAPTNTVDYNIFYS